MKSVKTDRQLAALASQGATVRLPDNGVSLTLGLELGNNGNVRGSRIR
jgi:hypothetical protein